MKKIVLIATLFALSLNAMADGWFDLIHASTIEIEGSTSGSGSLFVDGIITANEIIVENTSGADFVFDKNYQLCDLQEVKRYIQDNQHLPEIQSASEMKENGVNMTELQIKLLQKVEELTLYVIQQEETIKTLQEKVNILSK